MAGGKNDWVIEDSEEEDQLGSSQLDGRRPTSPLPEGTVSSIKTFTSIPAEKSSHISSVGAEFSARSTISSFPPPPPVDLSTISEASSKKGPRPRPRPIFSRTGPDPALNASVSDPIFHHVPSSDHHRDQFTPVSHSEPTIRETTQEIDPDSNKFSPDISERAKMRTRKATKRPSEEVIDISDHDSAMTPVRKPKERIKPRPVRRATPVENNPQINSDPATVPVFSSSPLLPPSDPFPASTLINSTPPRLLPPDEVAAPDSPPQESPIRPRKRKHSDRPRSPIDDLSDQNTLPVFPVRATSPLSDSLPPSEAVLDVADLGQNLDSKKKGSEVGHNVTRTPTKKLKSSNNAEKSSGGAAVRPERTRVGKSRKKAVVEVVIPSPRKTERMRAKVLGRNDSESRNNRPPSSPTPAKLRLGAIEDEGVHVSPQRGSGSDDELILAPKKQQSSKVKSRKGKKKAREPRSVDNDALSEINPSSERVAVGEEEGEEPRNDERHAEGSSRRDELPTPLLGNPKVNVPAQEVNPPKPSPMRETTAPGNLRYSLSQFNPKTPMRELIRRATSHPSAPFSKPSSPIASPLAKTSKSALRRIAPLHPTRRSPPPPPPRPPPPKKSKKMLNLEEKWELELEDEVEGWWALTDQERQDWRRAKRDKELGYDD